jgi:WD40 repeat protein
MLDTGTGQLFQLPYSASTKMVLPEWNPSGAQLAVSAADGSIVIWNVDRTSKSGQVAAILTGHEKLVTSLSWNVSGDYLASANWEEPYNLRIWDMKRHQLQMKIAGGNLYHVAWSPSGTTLAVTGIGGTWLFDMRSVLGEPEQALSAADLAPWAIPIGPSRPMVPVVWHPDGGLIAVGDFDGTIYVVNVITNTITVTISNPNPIPNAGLIPTLT